MRCRICGDHRRVISGRHLSKHDIDRETYMEEYHLTPDELIAKDFRRIQSSCRGYYPNGKNEWIAAMKNVCKKDGKIFIFPFHRLSSEWHARIVREYSESDQSQKQLGANLCAGRCWSGQCAELH